MTVIGRMPGGFLLVEESQVGPADYSAAPITLTFNDLAQNVEGVISVEISAVSGDSGSFMAHNESVVGRVLTVMVTGEDNTDVDDAVQRELVGAINLSNKTIRAVAYGR